MVKINERAFSKEGSSFITAVVAEWLRRLTRNQMGFSRAGSNPAGCVVFFEGKENTFRIGS